MFGTQCHKNKTEIKKPVANGMDLSIYAMTDMGYEYTYHNKNGCS
jgi:hypothetical protein